jgi:hypothetical protein
LCASYTFLNSGEHTLWAIIDGAMTLGLWTI